MWYHSAEIMKEGITSMKKRLIQLLILCGLTACFLMPALACAETASGDFFYFGTFEQDAFESNGEEPILWRVLDVDPNARQVLAVSEYGLYTMKYHRNNTKRSWGETDVRDWLNGAFLASFTAEERDAIQPTRVSGSTDYCFLLDHDQVSYYLQAPYLCYATPWAKLHGEEGAYVNADTGSSSWLVRADTTTKTIAWISGSGILHSPTDKKGVNYMTSKDNVVRPAMWVSMDAIGWEAGDDGFPLYAKTKMEIATRSGPSTGYNGIGSYFDKGGQIVRVLSRVHDGSIWWLQIEFEYKDAIVRCYTGLKRVDISITRVPDEPTGILGTGRVVMDTAAYYGPGTEYKRQVQKYTPTSGTEGDIISEENGWYCFEYKQGKEKVRVWLPEEAVEF